MNEQTSTTQAKGVKVMKLRLIATIVTEVELRLAAMLAVHVALAAGLTAGACALAFGQDARGWRFLSR